METLKLDNNEYRIKKMNAIQTLAIQTQISFDNVDTTEKCYNTILEMLEVKFSEDKWLPVKEKDKQIYLPTGIEDNIESIEALIKYGLSYLKDVFHKSNKSK